MSDINNQGKPHNFPVQPMPFIGRAEEIAEIDKLLEDASCRLLTLAGPGGIGKTRLAMEAASRALDHFTQGAYFISLQPVRTGDLLVQAIADTMHYSLAGSETPRTQLLNYLRDKEILLVLDNFEQLLSHAPASSEEGSGDGIAFLNEMLQSTPGVKLLITSREVLNLQSEWVYAIEGMIYPRSTQVENIENYSAVKLFDERAKRVRQGFSLSDELEGVVQICQLVEGMPLALELSASWVKSLDCAEIASELHQNLDLLATSLRDVPDRHKNIQAVFDHSWKLLTQNERDIFKRLSIFRGGFQRLAAERVAGATLQALSTLVDKSLIRRDASGRYQIHELLRQYAEEQLHRSVDEAEQIHTLHCQYYADFLNQKLEETSAGDQVKATLEIAAELENVRAAWNWAVEYARVEAIHKSTAPLLYFFQYQSRYFEGMSAFGNAIHGLRSLDADELIHLTLAELLNAQGWLLLRLGQLDKARDVLEDSLAMYNRHGFFPAKSMGTDPRTALGVLANILGDYDKADLLGKEAFRLSEEQENKWNAIFSLYVLTNAKLARGDISAAREHAQQAHVLAGGMNDNWFRTYILNDLGNISFALGEYSEAQEYFESSYAIRKEFDDPGGMAEALNHLAKIAVLRREYAEAERRLQESLAIYGKINDKGGLATTLDGLGMVACAIEEYSEASGYFNEAARIAIEIQYLPLMVSIAVNMGELWLQMGYVERSVELVSAVLLHPACGGETKKKAEEILARCRAGIESELYEAYEKRGQARAGDEPFHLLLADPIVFRESTRGQSDNVELINPLTSRELDVLRLIAEGYSNKDIAEKLVVTLGTIKWYNNQIFNKLNVTNRTRAVVRARELNLLP